MLIFRAPLLKFIMDFEDRLRRAALLERSVEMGLECMKWCGTVLKEKLSDRDSECLSTWLSL